MARVKFGPRTASPPAKGGLADRLAAELKTGRDFGQPLIYEHEFGTDRLNVNVVWDAWAGDDSEKRTRVILDAYEIAEGKDYRDRVVLASGLTVPEAHNAGMLPYQIIPGLRKTDPVSPDDIRRAMTDEGASVLTRPDSPQLRFATEAEAEACRRRLIARLPASEPVWIILRETAAYDFDGLHAGGDQDH